MELVFLIPIVALAAGTFIVKMALDHSRWKRQYDRGHVAPENSLGTGELKAIIREAVEEANEPLLGRIEALETRLDTLGEPRPTPLLDEALDAFETDGYEDASEAQRRTVR